MRLISRAALVFIAFVFANAPAHGQPQTVVTQVQLGVREAGKTYPLALNAQNADCKEPLDFRFTSNAAWLRLPADPVVRGVAAGQSRALLATIDLTNMSPGRYQATVEVECENCGWFIFQSCKIDKQQINFFLDVAPAAAPQPQGAQPQPAPRAIDPNDPRLPPAVAERLKKAYDARDAAGAKNPCKEELKRLAEEAKAAQDAANALNKKAADAEQAKKDAADKAKKAERDRDAAGKAAAKAANDANEAAKFADDMKGGPDEAQAKKDAAEAEAKRQKAVDDLTKAQKALDEARKAAAAANGAAAKAPSQAERDAADKKAKDAQAALAKKQAECDKAAADAKAAAEGEVAKAEKDAREALGVHQLTPEEELERLRQDAERCARECLDMARAQRIALEELAKVGLLHDQEALDKWAAEYNEIIDGVGGILGELGIPGTDYGALLAKGALVAVAAGAKMAGQREMQIRLTDPKATRDWLQGKGGGTPKVANPKEAEAVQREMVRATSGGLSQMTKDLADKNAACDAAQKKYEEAKQKLEASKGGK